MRAAAISKLKATLSEWIALVKAGEEVLITERGKAVARIVPVDGAQKENAKRMDLARRGIIRPGKGRISAELLKDLPMAQIPDEAVQGAIDADREESV